MKRSGRRLVRRSTTAGRVVAATNNNNIIRNYSVAARSAPKSTVPAFPGEPEKPVVKTQIPGPKTIERRQRLDKYQVP